MISKLNICSSGSYKLVKPTCWTTFWHWASPLIIHRQSKSWGFTFVNNWSCIWVEIHLVMLFIHFFMRDELTSFRNTWIKQGGEWTNSCISAAGETDLHLRTNQLSLNTKKLQGFTFTQRMQRERVCVQSLPKPREKRLHMGSGMPLLIQ
jgi:hypothetical protein